MYFTTSALTYKLMAHSKKPVKIFNFLTKYIQNHNKFEHMSVHVLNLN